MKHTTETPRCWVEKSRVSFGFFVDPIYEGKHIISIGFEVPIIYSSFSDDELIFPTKLSQILVWGKDMKVRGDEEELVVDVDVIYSSKTMIAMQWEDTDWYKDHTHFCLKTIGNSKRSFLNISKTFEKWWGTWRLWEISEFQFASKYWWKPKQLQDANGECDFYVWNLNETRFFTPISTAISAECWGADSCEQHPWRKGQVETSKVRIPKFMENNTKSSHHNWIIMILKQHYSP